MFHQIARTDSTITENKNENASLFDVIFKRTKNAGGHIELFYSLINGPEKWRLFIDGVRQNRGKKQFIPELLGLEVLINMQNDESNIDILLMPLKMFEEHLEDSRVEKMVKKQKQEEKGDKEEGGISGLEMLSEWLDRYIKNVSLIEPDGELTFAQLCSLDKGWLSFENSEKNYLISLLKTMEEMVKNLATPISVDFIKQLHFQSTSSLLVPPDTGSKETTYQPATQFHSGFCRNSNEDTYYPLTPNANTTLAGLEELFQRKEVLKKLTDGRLVLTVEGPQISEQKGNDPKAVWKKMNPNNNHDHDHYQLRSVINPKENETIEGALNYILALYVKNYSDEIVKCETPIAKLKCIVQFIKDCEQLHPFYDGNGRTFCMLLFYYLMLQNGFPPPLLADPNRFDCYSTEELVKEIIDGMNNTLAVVLDRKKDLNGVTTDEVLDTLSLAAPAERQYAASLGIAYSGKNKKNSGSKVRLKLFQQQPNALGTNTLAAKDAAIFRKTQ